MKLHQLWIFTLMEIKRILHDQRRLAILVLGPVILCLIFGYSAYTNPENIDLTVYVDNTLNPNSFDNPETRAIITAIDDSKSFTVIEVHSLKEASQRLEKGLTRGTVIFEEGPSGLNKIEITVDVKDRMVQQTIDGELPAILSASSSQRTIQTLSTGGIDNSTAAHVVTPFTLKFTTNENRQLSQFDLGSAGVITLFVVGISLIMASIAVTSERSRGTIERIFASPLNRWVLILSKVVANSLFAIIVALVIWLTLKIAFDITMGNMVLILILTILASINAIIMGLIASSITYTELESVGVAVVLWFNAMFLMGLTWPLETMHPIFTYLAQLMPFTYALHSMRNVNLIGWDFQQVLPDILVLLGFIVAQTVFATLVLRREIK